MFIKGAKLRQRGVSLLEMIMFLVIVSIALVGLLSTMNLTSQPGAQPIRTKQALMIAESLMEEVMLARFTWCDADDAEVFTAADPSACTLIETVGRSGEARPYNHVNDYVTAFGAEQAAFNNAANALVDAGGTPYPTAYSATLKLEELALNGVGAGDGASIKISISVTDTTTNQIVRLESYRLRYAPTSPP